MTDSYESLLSRMRQIGQLESIEALLDWDQETYMPPNGIASRAEQLALMAGLVHQRRADPEIGALLSRLDGDAQDPAVATNVREMRRTHDRATRVPADLVSHIARVSALAKAAWVDARNEASFSRFAPHLKELLGLKRELADCIGYEGERYDALVDEYEPGMRAERIAAVFTPLREWLTKFAQRMLDAPKQPDATILERHYPQPAQEALGRKLAKAIGFDFASGRIDVSVHPFCSGMTPSDVRLTTRYNESFFSSAIFGTLHEAGHGVYEQGLDSDHVGTPMGSAVSLGIHESQSLLWECMVGRSAAFWEYFYPDCQSAFPEALGGVSLDAFVASVNTVRRSLIRVEADEVTYGLHIVLRFELERDLIEERLTVEDVPEAWNAAMKRFLGVTPPNDAQGCLQDVHWSMGAFGYFPTYALGKIYAAQFYAAAERDIGDLNERICKGDFATLLEWLRENIYRRGQQFRAEDLVREVTGQGLSAEPFLQYLEKKYSPIYGL